jgi:alpha-mannosidase/mannosylglycerate hydrolase
MKQANDSAQNVLEKWSEPLTAIANLQGAGLPKRFLRIAWENVLLNHAHDSICGCSIDQVHRDMMYRFDQARVLGEQLRHQALGALTCKYRDLAKKEHEFTVSVANPLPRTRSETVIFNIDLPPDYPDYFHEGFRSQNIFSFTISDINGRDIPYQRLAFNPVDEERSRVARPIFINDGIFARYTVAARLDLPALGFTSLLIKPSPRPVRAKGTLRTGPTSAENEYLAVCIDSNGTLAVTHKKTGETYTDLIMFEDRSEIGDGWFHCGSLNDEQILSSSSKAQVSVVHDGPEVVTFRVTVTMPVPARYDWNHECASEEKVDLNITCLISLRRGAEVVDVETTVQNSAEDHRLRLLLPTDAKQAKTWLAHHPYDIVERSISVDKDTADWQEMELSEKPFLGFQAVGDGKRGLAFVCSGGLHEGGVADDDRRTMHITILRSFRRNVAHQGEPDGLEKGTITCKYALMPYTGKLPAAEVLYELAKLQAGIITRQTGKRASGYPPMKGRNRPQQSYLEQKSGNLAISSIKPGEKGDDLIIRLWNPCKVKKTETLVFWKKIRNAKLLKLSEEPLPGAKKIKTGSKSVTIEAGPHKIVTVSVGF